GAGGQHQAGSGHAHAAPFRFRNGTGSALAGSQSAAHGLEQVRAIQDFDAARFRAFWKSLGATLTGRSRRLPSLDAVLAAAGAEGRSFGGVHEIPLNAIVGSASSLSKTGDFDAGFLPVSRRLRHRWTRIYRE